MGDYVVINSIVSAVISTTIGSLLVIIYEQLTALKERERTVRPILDHSVQWIDDFNRSDPFRVRQRVPASVGVIDFTTTQWIEKLHIEFQPTEVNKYGVTVEFKNISSNFALKLRINDMWIVFDDDDVAFPFVVENLNETYTSPNEISKIVFEFIISDEEFDSFAANTKFTMIVMHCSYCDIDNKFRHDAFPVYVNFSTKGTRHLELAKINNVIGESSKFNYRKFRRLLRKSES